MMKSNPLTQFAVNPSRLQLQNVQHVLKVFNDKVVDSLMLRGCRDTAKFIQTILNWWNVVNVSGKGQDMCMNDLYGASGSLVNKPAYFPDDVQGGCF